MVEYRVPSHPTAFSSKVLEAIEKNPGIARTVNSYDRCMAILKHCQTVNDPLTTVVRRHMSETPETFRSIRQMMSMDNIQEQVYFIFLQEIRYGILIEHHDAENVIVYHVLAGRIPLQQTVIGDRYVLSRDEVIKFISDLYEAIVEHNNSADPNAAAAGEPLRQFLFHDGPYTPQVTPYGYRRTPAPAGGLHAKDIACHSSTLSFGQSVQDVLTDVQKECATSMSICSVMAGVCKGLAASNQFAMESRAPIIETIPYSAPPGSGYESCKTIREFLDAVATHNPTRD